MPYCNITFQRIISFLVSGVLSLIIAISSDAAVKEPLITNGGYMVVNKSGTTEGAHHAETLYTPASIFKIATALQALETLGPTYRFPTYFYITPGIDLYIVGTGDPLLISEEIEPIVTTLHKRGIRQLRHLYIDNSRFNLSHKTINDIISKNPYDSALSATGVNFNTMQLLVERDNSITSGEPQTPTLPLMESIGQGLEPGIHRINLGQNNQHLIQYAGQLFKSIFAEKGVTVTGHIASRKTPASAGLFYTHYSKSLEEIIPLMLLYSNNYMANLIYLNAGIKQYGHPATWDKAEKALRTYLKSNKLIQGEIVIQDGAGLASENKVNCKTMVAILQKFRPFMHLLPLKKGTYPLKSGTMTGIYSYAGYLGTHKDAKAIVLILNQQHNNRDALFDQLSRAYGPPKSNP